MVAEGCTLCAVKQGLDFMGIKSPTGKPWHAATIREIVKDDVYLPHTYEEITTLVSAEVASRLEPENLYGVFWFNTKRRTQAQVAEAGPDGGTYRRRVKTVEKPREEWVEVPVPDAGIPRQLVDDARTRLSRNARASSSGTRFWELSGGLVGCGLRGRRMSPSTTVKGGGTHHYCRCDKRWQDGPGACSHVKHHRAHKQLTREAHQRGSIRNGPRRRWTVR
jgi:Recombinase